MKWTRQAKRKTPEPSGQKIAAQKACRGGGSEGRRESEPESGGKAEVPGERAAANL